MFDGREEKVGVDHAALRHREIEVLRQRDYENELGHDDGHKSLIETISSNKEEVLMRWNSQTEDEMQNQHSSPRLPDVSASIAFLLGPSAT